MRDELLKISPYVFIVVALALIGTIQGVVSYLAYLGISDLLEQQRLVEHTHQVIETGDDVLTELLNLETGQRGFLLTQNPDYLEPYHMAENKVEAGLSTLKKLTEDNPAQQKRIETLSALIGEKRDELKSTIDSAQQGAIDLSLKIVKENKGKQVMDKIRDVLSEIDNEENSLLKQRSDRANMQAANTSLMLTVIIPASIVGTIVTVAFLFRYMSTRLKAEKKIQLGNLYA